MFVSHNLGLVRSMTEQAVWLDHGKVVDEGPTEEVLGGYGRRWSSAIDQPAPRVGQIKQLLAERGLHRWGAAGPGSRRSTWASVRKTRVRMGISYEATDLDEALFCVGSSTKRATRWWGAVATPPRGRGGEGAVSCAIRPLRSGTGLYFPVVAILLPTDRFATTGSWTGPSWSSGGNGLRGGWAPRGDRPNWVETSEGGPWRDEPRLPDFVIIGAMKSATTHAVPMARALPDCFLAQPKEMNFFSLTRRGAADPAWYSSDSPRAARAGSWARLRSVTLP